MASCGDCKFYGAGECRAHPPTVIPNSGYGEQGNYKYFNTVFPEMPQDGWCGEHQSRVVNKTISDSGRGTSRVR